MRGGQSNPRAGLASDHRRTFLKQSAVVAASAWLASCTARSLASPVTEVTLVPPTRERGATRVSVREHGARGDGSQDDTMAIQAAIDALPPNGGTVYVPAGDYPVDAIRSIRLRDSMHLELAPGARLVALANSVKRSFVLSGNDIADVEISGGEIVGEREKHLGSEGEWGHGIRLVGVRRATLRDTRVSDCWGDGIYVGGSGVGQATPSEDIVLSRVVSTGNRRQGLSVLHSRNVRIHDSEFSHTSGTNPQFGIDIEPNKPAWAYDVHIENCRIRDNHGGGIQIYKRVSGVTIRRCTIENNLGPGIVAVSADHGVIEDNIITRNGLAGVALRQQAKDFRIAGNRFSANATRRVGSAPSRHGVQVAPASAIRAASDTEDVVITGNDYGDE